jgi:hypothetical protein
MSDDWSREETDDPLYPDRRNFYKVERWNKDGLHIEEMLAGNNLDKARTISAPDYQQILARHSIPSRWIVVQAAVAHVNAFDNCKTYRRAALMWDQA